MSAYYNEIDPKAAAWLRELIAQGHIAPGVVDERSIEDVTPAELVGFTQCHFFAGIGVWSYALRLAGWPDDRPVWTGSCPCQPFSTAGKGAGFSDERHLWPAWHWLIEQCRPPEIYGEQVADGDGEDWLDLVLADLEGSLYAAGSVDFCAAGVGSPNIRQRLWLYARRLADAESSGIGAGLRDRGSHRERRDEPANGGGVLRMGEPIRKGLEGYGRHGDDGDQPRRLGAIEDRPATAANDASGLADTDGGDSGAERQQLRLEQRQFEADGRLGDGDRRPGPTSGFWRNADWLLCRDGSWRPVEPSTFPLAHGAPARVGRLRGYGNAINAQVAAQIIKATMNEESAYA